MSAGDTPEIPGRLTNAAGPDFPQLFCCFQPKPSDRGIICILRQKFSFQPLHLLHLQLLFFDISFVFEQNLYFFRYGGRQIWPLRIEGLQIFVGNLRRRISSPSLKPVEIGDVSRETSRSFSAGEGEQ